MGQQTSQMEHRLHGVESDPGDVRESGLRAAAVAGASVDGGGGPPGPDTPLQHRSLVVVREDAEREHILAVLRLAGGKRGEAARILGISRKTLWKKLKRMTCS